MLFINTHISITVYRLSEHIIARAYRIIMCMTCYGYGNCEIEIGYLFYIYFIFNGKRSLDRSLDGRFGYIE